MIRDALVQDIPRRQPELRLEQRDDPRREEEEPEDELGEPDAQASTQTCRLAHCRQEYQQRRGRGLRQDVPMEVIRPLSEPDAQALLELRLANRQFLAPFEPERPDAFFTLETQTEIARNPEGLAFAILDAGLLAGTISLSHVARGSFQSANVGYWVTSTRNGRGLATRAVGELAEHAFAALDLHRLEAGTLVDNLASQRVLHEERLRNGSGSRATTCTSPAPGGTTSSSSARGTAGDAFGP